MSDGNWEAIRRGHNNSQAAADAESASAAAEAGPGRADSRIAQSADPITGWRVWGLSTGTPMQSGSRPNQPLILVSVYMSSIWHPGEVMTACCNENSVRHGIHAFTTSAEAIIYMNEARKQMRYVYGEVSLWGRVVIHERGYRAVSAYPRRIFVPHRYRGGRDYVMELRRSYGIEVDWTIAQSTSKLTYEKTKQKSGEAQRGNT